ncbi:MAG: hypothetical protein ACKOAG_05460, partial [Candidatus Kapaibacterium sp.]
MNEMHEMKEKPHDSAYAPRSMRGVWMAIAVLAVMNIAMAVVLWGPMDLRHPHHEGPPPPRGPEPSAFLIER